jgi:hypothetical protein
VNIWLAAVAGSIGASDNAVEIDSAGLVTAVGLQSIVLAETAGDLVLGLVSSSLGAVQLAATAAIRDDDDGAAVDISGSGADLTAAAGIGQSSNALETQIGLIEADAGTGDVWLVNSGALEVNDVTADGEVSIVALSPLTVSGNILSASVYLEAADTPGPGDDLTLQSGATITATAGDVTLIAGDDLVIEAGSVVTAEGAVSLSAGGNLQLSGTVDAESMHITGSDGANVIAITNLSTDTLVQTLARHDSRRKHATPIRTLAEKSTASTRCHHRRRRRRRYRFGRRQRHVANTVS